jgi:hypothetical protein
VALLYLDASALVKIYIRERDSDAVEARLEGRRDLIVSDLTITEVASSLARRKRDRTLPDGAAETLYQGLWDDLRAGMFQSVEMASPVFREAERLLLAGLPLRAGDSLHLGAAAVSGALVLMTFDRQLGAAARTLGLEVLP